jgi:hypothetical protein
LEEINLGSFRYLPPPSWALIEFPRENMPQKNKKSRAKQLFPESVFFLQIP